MAPDYTQEVIKKRHYSREAYSGKTDISLHMANDSDKEFISLLSKSVFQPYGPYEKTVPKWFDSDIVITVVAWLDLQPVGFVMLENFSERYDLRYSSEILAIAVVPDMHGMRIGDLLLNSIEKEAVYLNIKRLFLHTAVENLPARNLFTRNGFRTWEIKLNFYPAGQDAIVMSKEI